MYNVKDENILDTIHPLLGYSPRQLQNHIKSHVNYKNINHNKITKDHIFPRLAFTDYKIYRM